MLLQFVVDVWVALCAWVCVYMCDYCQISRIITTRICKDTLFFRSYKVCTAFALVQCLFIDGGGHVYYLLYGTRGELSSGGLGGGRFMLFINV